MDKKEDFIEQILGGIFAVIAVVAAICEMFVNGIGASSIVSCIKDDFGTMAVIVLFFAIIKDRISKRKFLDKLKAALAEWQNNNSTLT